MLFSQLKSPGIVTTVDRKNVTLYISTVKSIEEATKPNLKKSLAGFFREIFMFINFCVIKYMPSIILQ